MRNSPNGVYLVRPGDTISAYCSQIYGIPPAQTRRHWGEFARMVNGKLQPLADPNMIRAGEKVYHLPSFRNASIDLPEAQIVGAAWPQMCFRFSGFYYKVGYAVASAMYMTGRLEVRFSHLADVYGWETKFIFVLSDPFKFPSFDGGVIATNWSTPIEFSFRDFDPVEWWKNAAIYPDGILSRAHTLAKLKILLKWAVPKQRVIRHPNGSPHTGFHLRIPVLTLDTIGANPFPNFDGGPAITFALKDFHKLAST